MTRKAEEPSLDVRDRWDRALYAVAFVCTLATGLGMLLDHGRLEFIGLASTMATYLVLVVRQGLRRTHKPEGTP